MSRSRPRTIAEPAIGFVTKIPIPFESFMKGPSALHPGGGILRQVRNELLWVAVAAILLTVIFGDLPGEGHIAAVLQDSCHAPAFAALTLIGLILLGRRHAPQQPMLRALLARCAGVVGMAVLLGAATEGVQWLVGRDADPNDVLRDFIGAGGMACAWLYLSLRSSPEPSARLIHVMALLACIGATAWWASPLVECGRAYWDRSGQFPVLARFQSQRDLYFITSTATDARIVAPGALRLVLDSGPWPGVSLDEPVPDWRGYRTLALDVANPGPAPLPLQLRVNDRRHNGHTDDRFNTEFSLPPSTRLTIRIALEDIAHAPRARRMDLGRISQLILFRDTGAPDQVLLLHRIWLQ